MVRGFGDSNLGSGLLFAWCPCACVGFLQALWFPPSVSGCLGVSPAIGWRPIRVSLPLVPGQLREAPADPCDPSVNNAVA